MSYLGKIIIEKNNDNPIVVISNENKHLWGLELIKASSSIEQPFSKLELPITDFINIENYGKRKVNNHVVDCSSAHTIFNLNIREIGELSANGYCKVLRRYTSYQALMGASSSSYLLVRDEVNKQLIKMMEKGIYGL